MTPEQYAEKKQARIDRLQERAEAKRKKAERLIRTGDEALAQIPLGQPILIGHHSERSDRNYRNRAFSKIERGMEMSAEATRLAQRAGAAASNHAIFSDDPEAVRKLEEKIAKAEQRQETMKTANRIIRSKPKNEITPEKLERLAAIGCPESAARELFERDCCGRIGFPDYALQNNNANIRRMKERIEELRSAATIEETEIEHDGFTVVHNTEENRVQLIFPGKPDEGTRTTLKRYGFRWAPSQGAWQRQLNANGIYAAQQVAQALA